MFKPHSFALCCVDTLDYNKKLFNFDSNTIPLEQQISLMKTSDLVKEFPDLQGKIGGYYASKEGLPVNFCDALSDQYEYEFSSEYKNFLTFILSISQKFDGIMGYFISQKGISGAGDPFGIRRLALSIIKICIEHKICVNFIELFNYLKKLYNEQNIPADLEYKVVYEFFKKRIIILFVDLGFRHDIVKASFFNKDMNPYLIYQRVIKLSKFVKSKEGTNFLKAFKRLNSLVGNDEGKFNDRLIESKEEEELNKIFLKIKDEANLKKQDFILTNVELLKKITLTLNNFFDNVIVNVSNPEIKKNRKILINNFHNRLNSEYNFSFLEN